MSDEVRCRCGGKIVFDPISDVPPPPGAMMAIAPTTPDVWRGWIWRCQSCGEQVGFTYDYGTIDLGLVGYVHTDNRFEIEFFSE